MAVSPLSSIMNSSDLDPSDARADLPRPYKCPHCDKAFHRLEHQTRHIRTHTGEKPHACHFPGCSKRFSRSDELTRHSRIHNNPNSRRNNRSHQGVSSSAPAPLSRDDRTLDAVPMLRPGSPRPISKSAPSSSFASPNVSPPSSYVPPSEMSTGAYFPAPSAGAPWYHGPPRRGASSSSVAPNPLDMHLLATAACEVERKEQPGVMAMRPAAPPRTTADARRRPFLPYQVAPAGGRTSSLSVPREAPCTCRGFATFEQDNGHCSCPAARALKRSRPTSPSSTAPSSPTFSNDDSCSPTPDHTPLATPAQSPRLRPWTTDLALLPLPSFRTLTLGGGSGAAGASPPVKPVLATMEPRTAYLGGSMGGGAITSSPSLSVSVSSYHHDIVAAGGPACWPPSSGGRLNEILSHPDASKRKLPEPHAAATAVLHEGSSGSVTAHGFADRL